MHLRIHTLRIKLLIGFLLSCFAMQAQTPTPVEFSPRLPGGHMKIKGDVVFIGNNILNRGANTTEANVPYNGGNDNNSHNMEYIDIDGDPSTFSSSSADLALAGSCYRVVYAGLYWASTYPYERSTNSGQQWQGTIPRFEDWNEVKFKLPGGAYVDLVADDDADPVGEEDDIIFDGFNPLNITQSYKDAPIVCYKNITGLVQSLSNPNGTYTLANLRAAKGRRDGSSSAGWVMVVIYEDPMLPGKFISTFDGYKGVGGGSSTDININGFNTLPPPQPVRARLGVGALEGDRGITDDRLRFRANSLGGFTNMTTGTRNPANNFFNSTITNDNEYVTTRVPNSENTQGIDLDMFQMSNNANSVIPNNETGATLRLETSGDGYGAFLATFAVEIIEPDITLVKKVENLAGDDITGDDVTLGQVLEYVVRFQNVGNDNATNFTIRDILPVNTFYQSVDFGTSGASIQSYDPVTREIVFSIPNDKVEISDPADEIRITVQVVNTCSELTDACSNIIQNTAYATYQGEINTTVISDDPSYYNYDVTCGIGSPGPSNFLVDIDDCTFEREEVLCGGSVTLTAGDGFVAYTWYDSDGNEIGNTQSIVVNAVGQYHVVNTAPPGCVGITEYINVVLHGATQINPVIPFGDEVSVCNDDGTRTAYIFLCGINDTRLIQTGILDADTIVWQKLNEGSCAVDPFPGCPSGGVGCTWTQVGTGPDFEAALAGEYRLVITYQNGCFTTFNFNVYANLLDPQYTRQHIFCTSDGEIAVTNVPSGYEYQLIDQATNTVVVPYQNDPVFPITTAGIYTVQLRQIGVTDGCVFELTNIGVQNRNLDVNVIKEDVTCNGFGSIRLQALNVAPQYYFSLTGPGGINLSYGPVEDNNQLFENLNPGDYNYTVTTEDGCSESGTVTIIDSTLELTASVSQHISCDQGNIQMSSTGGRSPYTYAVYSYNGVLENPVPTDFQTSVIFDIPLGEQGDYVFVMEDGNGCITLSNPVTINLVPDVDFATLVENVTCNGFNNGSIAYTINNSNGFNVSFDLYDSTDVLLETNNSGIFTGLAPGDYTVNLNQTKGNKSCTFPSQFTITEPDPITGTASVIEAYNCINGGATVEIDPASVTGGTGPYEYSIDGINFGSATTFTGLTAGTYTATIRDDNGCTFAADTFVIDPLTPPTALTFSATTPNCPALTSDVTVSVTGGVAPFNYEIIAPSGELLDNGTNAVFTGLAAGTYTFEVTDANGCTISDNFTIDALTPINTNGQALSDVTCFGAADGVLNFNIGGFSTNYTYTIENSAGTVVSSSATETAITIPLTNLAPDTYTIEVTDNVTNCTATEDVIINGPASALTVSNTALPITCNADGSVTVNASGGWGSFEYELEYPDGTIVGPQSGSSFSGLTQDGNYTISVTDANNCTFTDTFTLTDPVPPVASLNAATDICINANGASITVDVTGGQAPFTYSLNGGTPQSSNVFSSLLAGTYTITVTDAYGCTDDTPAQTIAPQLLVQANLQKGLDCTASPGADIEVGIIGGAAPYTYEVSYNGSAYSAPVATTTPFTYTTAANADGTYQFRITDANNCSVVSGIVTVQPLTPPAITSVTQTQQILCNGSETGSIEVVIDATVGVGPYVINVRNTTIPQNFGTQTSGLPAGDYVITVTDANMCVSTVETITLNEPDPITYDMTIVNITCNNPGGVALGQIILENVSGGSGSYTYYLSNNFTPTVESVSAPTGQDHTFTILNFGIYQVDIVDSNGCTVIRDNIIIASPPDDLDIVISPTPPADCISGGGATVTVGALVGSGNYEFAVLETVTPPYSSNYQPANIGTDTYQFTGLTPGVLYTFVVHDITTDCYYFESATTTIPTLSTLTALIDSVNNVTCTGAGDGTINFTIDDYNAVGQVNYEIFNAQANTTTGITGIIDVSGGGPVSVTNAGPLNPGVYYILFTEADGTLAGCNAASGQFTITQSAVLLEVNATVTKNDNCNTDAGIITATAQFGTAPYEFMMLPDGSTAPDETTPGWTSSSIFNAEGGSYIVYVKDAYNCIQQTTAPIVLSTDPEPVIALSVVQQCDTAEGTFSITVDRTTDGIAPYTYSFNGGAFQPQAAASFTYNNLISGIYTVDIRDANGCTNQQSITIYPPVNLSPAATAQPTCADDDGTITVTGVGGSGNFEYELQDDSNNTLVAAQLSNVFTGQASGNYVVVIHDTTTSCTEEAAVSLEAATPVIFTTTLQAVSCFGGSNGTISVNLPASNNNPVYTYTLNDGVNPPVVQNSPVFTGLSAGNYDITVTSGKNCDLTETVEITEPDLLEITATNTEFECNASNTVSTVTITASGTGGTSPYTYSINNTNFFTSNTFEVADNGSVQNITVTIRDSNNCTDTYSFTLNPLPEIASVTATQTTGITCTNDEVVTVEVTGGSGDFTFELLPTGAQPVIIPGAGNQEADFNLTAPGSYTFRVTDNVTGCYMNTVPYVVAPYDTIEVEASLPTQVTCFGDTDGTLTIDVTGYTGDYNYEVINSGSVIANGTGNSAVNPLVISGLPAGNHSVTITATDSPFCSADSNTVTVPSPANPLVLNAAQTASVTCDNNVGEITATANGGWGTYEFELVNNTTPATVQAFDPNGNFTGLAAGNYTVSVRDAGGCIVTQTIDLVQPSFITADIDATGTTLLCNGDTTATVSVINVTGGEGVYQYILNTYDATGTTIVSSSGAQTGTTFANLGAGIYSITVTDGWNCDVTTTTVEVTEPDPVMGYLSLTDGLTCTTDAQLTVSASGGSGTYTYSTDGVTFTSTTTYDVGAGTYQFYVQDSNGCTAVVTNEVTVLPVPPLVLNLDLTGANINCFGEATAEISADATGGLGGYQYELYDNTTNTLLDGPQADETFSDLSSGEYYVRVISGDCENTSGVIEITEPTPFEVDYTKTDILCHDETNGSITINTISPGTGTIQYAISPNLNQFDTENTFTSLAPGWYDVIAQDQNGCFEFFQIEIINPDPLAATVADSIDELCYGDATAEITVEITGGTGIYEISIDGGAYVPVAGSTHTFTGLTAIDLSGQTLFEINVRDTNGCDLTPTLNHFMDPPVDIQPAVESIVYNCTGNTPGNIVTIGVNTAVAADVEYSVDNGTYQPSNVFTNLTVGTHTVDVRHTNGCIKSVTFDIEHRDPVAATAVVTADVLCFGESTGEITVTVTDGEAPYEYAISTNPANFVTSNVFTGLAAGSYTVTVRDAIGCEFTTTAVTVIEPTAALTATESVTHEICLGANDGTVTLDIQDGTPPYFTSLDGAAHIEGQLIYSNLAPGTYTMDVTDSAGCAITPITFTIDPGVDIQATADVHYGCSGNTPGNLVFVQFGSMPADELEFSLDGINYQADNIFVDLAPGNYTAYLQHDNGCIDTVTFEIEQRDPVVATAAVTADVLCFGESTGEITVTVTDGTSPYQYAISTDPTNFVTSNVFTGLAAGTYTITVRDSIGCEFTTTAVSVIEPTAALTATESVTHEICLGANDGTVILDIQGGTSPYFTSLDGAAPIEGQLIYSSLAPGTYTMDVTDSAGCAITPITFTIDPGVDIQAVAETTIYSCTGNTPNNETTISVDASVAADVEYSLDGGAYQSSNVFTNLTVGTHTVDVEHSNGCIDTVTFEIEQRDPIAATAAVTADVLCFGESTGEITVTVTDGEAPYEFAISTDPANFVTSNVFTGLVAGSYTITVRDAIGCEFTTTTVTVGEPAAALTATESVTHEICLGANDGTVTLDIQGGTSPYFTSLDGAAPIEGQTTYSSLAPGTYTMDVTDNAGCAITPITFTIDPGVDIQAVAETTIYSCTGNTPNNETTITVDASVAADVQYSLDGGAYQSSNVFTNLTVGTYTVDVQHSNGCIDTVTFEIEDHQPITIDPVVAVTDVLCFGEAMGAITVTATGGTSPLEYAISPDYTYGTSNTFTGLIAGTYTVRVRDAIGCIDDVSAIIINEPASALTASAAPTPEICLGANDGTVTITVSGGTAPYETMLDSTDPADYASVFDYTGLTAGTHTIYVRDANNCEHTPITFTIDAGVDIQAVAETTIYSCTGNTPNNETTVTVDASVTGDVEYSLDGGAYQSSNVFTNLAVGTHTVDVEHSNGCIDTVTFEIEDHQPITIDPAVAVTDVLCFGEATGEITVTATGGTTPLEYAISPDYTYGTSNTFTGLIAGAYTVRVRDAIGCIDEVSAIIINEPTAVLDVAYTSVNETCTSLSDGSIALNVTGGTAPYYTSLNSNDPADFTQDVFSYTGLAGGNYTVYVVDANGCEFLPIDITIEPGIDIQAAVETTVYNCTDNVPGNSTTVTVNPDEAANMQYSLDGGAYQPSNVFTNLAAGTHTVDVQHINGCTETVTFDVEDHQPIAASATVTSNVFCYADDTGEIEVTATGGTGQLEYAISPWYNYTTNNVFTTLVAGNYTIIVRDEIGCEYVINDVIVTQPDTPIVATIEFENETCLNANDGSVTISVSGGTGPYSTSMDGVNFVQDQFTYSSLGGGQHIVFVQDATGCQIIPIVFNIEDGVYINPDVTVQPVCNEGNLPGNEVIVTVAPDLVDHVEYSLDGINYQDSNIFYNLPPGEYTIYVRHENGCVRPEEFTVILVKPIDGIIEITDALCNGNADGAITVNGSGGIGNLTYGISPDYEMSSEFEFTNLSAGDYTIRIQDETGCYAEYPVTVNEPEELEITVEETFQEICENDDNAAIVISIAGGTAPYSSSLTPDGGFEEGREMYSDLNGGHHTIYVRDAKGCIASIDVELDDPITINAIANVAYDCQENTLIVEVEDAIEGYVTYSLNGAEPQNSNVFENLPDGSYTVEVLHTSGCMDTTESVTIVNNAPLTLHVTESGLNQLTATASGGAGGYTYTFNDNYMGTTNVFEYYSSGTYEIVVTDSRGCSDVILRELEFVDITLPDIMTPNEDGMNDGWAPGNTANYPNLEFFVFDRYGRKLASLRPGQEWDGKYNGVELPTGDYWYIVKLNNPENDREYVGHFTIYR